MKRITLILLSFFTYLNSAYALQDTIPYTKLDNRNSYVNYVPNNVINVNGTLGYITSLVFPPKEQITNIIQGVDNVWAITQTDNIVFLKPIIAYDQNGTSSDNINDNVTEPDPDTWKTNLVVLTANNHYYQFQLNYVKDPKDVNFKINILPTVAHVIHKPLTKQQIISRQIAIKKYKEKLKQQAFIKSQKENLTDIPIPKNWNFTYQIGKNSTEIVPKYTYSTDKFIYIGFNKNQPLPRPFKFFNNKEILVDNFILREKDTIILVIKSLPKQIILRYDDQVVKVSEND